MQSYPMRGTMKPEVAKQFKTVKEMVARGISVKKACQYAQMDPSYYYRLVNRENLLKQYEHIYWPS